MPSSKRSALRTKSDARLREASTAEASPVDATGTATAEPSRSWSRAEGVLLPLVTLSAAIAMWQLAVAATQTAIFPAPVQVVQGLGEILRKGLLVGYVRDSLVRVSAGYLLAVIAA